MSESKPASKQTIALLGVGSAAALGAAYWSISSALAPGPVPSTHASAPVQNSAPTANPSTATTTRSAPSTAAPITPLDGSAAQISSSHGSGQLPGTAAPTNQVSAGARATTGAGSHEAPTSEALLAPQANPFVQLPTKPDPSAAVTQPAPSGAQRSAGQLSPPVSPLAGIRPMNPGLGGPIAANRQAPAPVVAPEPIAPELVGTLLGDTPNAVFRGASQFVAVPVGGSYNGWKVVDVRQGEAVIKRKGQLIVLQAGTPSTNAFNSNRGSGLMNGVDPGVTPARQAASRSAFAEPKFAVKTRIVERRVQAPIKNLEPFKEESGDAFSVADSITNGSALAVVASTRPTLLPADPDSLPVLRDTPLTPEGRPITQPSDPGVTGRSEQTTTSDAVGLAPKDDALSGKPLRSGATRISNPANSGQASPVALRPFRRLVSVTGHPGYGPGLYAQTVVRP